MKSTVMNEYKRKIMWPVLALSVGLYLLCMFFWILKDGWREVSKSFVLYYIPILLLFVLGGRWKLFKKQIKYLESATLEFKLNGFGKVEDSIVIEPSPVFFDHLQAALLVSHLDLLFADKASGVLKLKESFRLFKANNAATIHVDKERVEILVYSFDGKKRKSTTLLARDLKHLIETLKG